MMTGSRIGAIGVSLAAVAITGGAAALATCTAGCAAAALAQMAPAGIAAAQMVTLSAAEQASGGGQDAKDEQNERCDDLVKATPGIEEVRKTKDGVIESRQWRLTERDGTPVWLFVHTRTAPQDGWQPKPGLAKLRFTPSLTDMLVPGEPQFLAYAPVTALSQGESDQMASMTSAFGAGDGTFEWRGRAFSFTLIKKLPCFKPGQ